MNRVIRFALKKSNIYLQNPNEPPVHQFDFEIETERGAGWKERRKRAHEKSMERREATKDRNWNLMWIVD
ncbi:hypothetical protein Syun_021606 [Stephania yunnanensis]|uniref:Uncharacterized protein n=1 Tax=Stephania yunnanensis TaxID=152371 RepID=A0AAP0IFW6_9MAGN